MKRDLTEMKESNYLIEINDIRKQYGKGEAAVYALDGIDFMVSESTHNISMLKVLGYEDKKINSMVIDANHLLLVPGILLGMLAAYGIMACAEPDAYDNPR